MTSSLESLLAHRRAKIAARFGGIVDLNLTDNNLNEHLNNTNPSTNDILSNVTHNVTLPLSTVTRKRSRRKTKPANIHLDVQRRKWSPIANDPQTGNDPQIGPQMIPDVDRKWSPPENNEWHGLWFLGFF